MCIYAKIVIICLKNLFRNLNMFGTFFIHFRYYIWLRLGTQICALKYIKTKIYFFIYITFDWFITYTIVIVVVVVVANGWAFQDEHVVYIS